MCHKNNSNNNKNKVQQKQNKKKNLYKKTLTMFHIVNYKIYFRAAVVLHLAPRMYSCASFNTKLPSSIQRLFFQKPLFQKEISNTKRFSDTNSNNPSP